MGPNKGHKNVLKTVKADKILANITGKQRASRSEFVRLVWKYIKEHHYQNPSDGRQVYIDENLSYLMGQRGEFFNAFKMLHHIEAHLIKDDDFEEPPRTAWGPVPNWTCTVTNIEMVPPVDSSEINDAPQAQVEAEMADLPAPAEQPSEPQDEDLQADIPSPPQAQAQAQGHHRFRFSDGIFEFSAEVTYPARPRNDASEPEQ